MGAHKPRSGSLAYYPKVRAKKQTAVFSTYPVVASKEAKPITFYGYKAGMVHLFGRNSHEKSVSFGQEIMIPSTVIECPPLRVVGVRVYAHTTSGSKILGEVTTDKPDKHLRKRIKSFKKKGRKKAKEAGNHTTFEMLEKMKERAEKVTLTVEVQGAL